MVDSDDSSDNDVLYLEHDNIDEVETARFGRVLKRKLSTAKVSY
jgi:hypothetical protein